MKLLMSSLVLALSLTACGGGGGGGTPAPVTPPPVTTVYPPPASLANICTTPADEKSWVRSHLDDVYLWYRDIVNVDPAAYVSAIDYFNALRVVSKDRFSFAMSQADADAYFGAGTTVGYGDNLVRDPSGKLRVTYSEPNSPAKLAGIDRGTTIVNIDGVAEGSLTRANFLNALYPPAAGATHTFDVLDPGATQTHSVTLTAATVVGSPVLKSQVLTLPSGRNVGYIVFNDHVQTAEAPLTAAIQQFSTVGVDDLVLDVRYNGGGYLYIASEIAYMIGGAPVKNQTFDKLRFNDKHPEKTNDPANTMPFFDGDTKGNALPTLGLNRVFVLTGPGTCSASEAIINGLKPFINVVTIGGTSCGKPYGMMQTNNCATAYFAIEFEGVNSAGQDNFASGFHPICPAADDLEHGFGDTSERLLATALVYQSSGACPSPALAVKHAIAGLPAVPSAADLVRAPWRENSILTRH